MLAGLTGKYIARAGRLGSGPALGPNAEWIAEMNDDEFPNRLPRPAGELEALQRAWASPRGWRRLSAVNNTQIGVFYLATALLFFVLAGVLALVMRAQLALPDSSLVSAGTYNQLFTMHGTVMMFLFAVPVVEAVAVLPAAAACWARATCRSRACRPMPSGPMRSAASPSSARIFFGASPDGGWFMYPPLTGKQLFARHRRGLVAAGHRLHRDLGHRRGDRDDHRHPVHPRAGHDA